jgi:hypothetical protein
VARFPAKVRPGRGRRRGSGGLCSTAMLGRGTGDHGELECVVYFLDCFQAKMRATAGELRATKRFG